MSIAFEIAWDPGLRGILATAAIVVALCGSVYLILATNMGSRLGFLVAAAGLSGWMALMGFVWALYGIGYLGTAAHWEVQEVVTSDDPHDLSAAQLEKAHDLSEWRELAADDPARGEAQATASAALAGEESRVAAFEAESDFIAIDAYTIGGKDENFFNNWFPGPHPPHYTIVQVQAVQEVEVEFGATPPPAEADESAPVQSVIMVRDLGKKRVPAVLLSLSSLIVFGITCNVLHRRDKALMAARAAAGV